MQLDETVKFEEKKTFKKIKFFKWFELGTGTEARSIFVIDWVLQRHYE